MRERERREAKRAARTANAIGKNHKGKSVSFGRTEPGRTEGRRGRPPNNKSSAFEDDWKEPKKPKEKINVACCAVCYRVQIENKISTDNPFLRCSGPCRETVHKRCLGTTTQASMDLTSKAFKCPVCTAGVNRHRLKCAVCMIEGKGYYTQVTNVEGHWVHAICGMLCDNYVVEDVRSMKFVFLREAARQDDDLIQEYAASQMSQLTAH